jgi:tetratricopeptide (TPR) repeat protein
MGKIADILQQRGDSEEALRIYREEELAIYELLGDLRSRAITMGKIADILQQRGDSEEALRIHREGELPVFERLGDVSSRAVTMGKIASILQQRGDSEEALRIRLEEELPVYERLGNVREWALTMGKICDILQQSGNNEEALRILSVEVLPAAEKIEDMALLANTLYKCGAVRLICCGLENQVDVQRIAEELKRSFDLSCQIHYVDGIACAGSLFGQLLAKSGFINEALIVLQKAADAFEMLQKPDQAAKLRKLVGKFQERVQ